MTTKVSTPRPIQIQSGVQPVTDWTRAATSHYTDTLGIRFVLDLPEKIGGWMRQVFDYGASISGVVRSIFTEVINDKYYVVLGSNEKLYSLIGSRLTNISPLKTTTTAIANSLTTQYGTLVNNPLSSTNGSAFLTVSDVDAARFKPGDIVTLSGATGFAGILAGAINGNKTVRSVGIGTYTINVGTNANATTTGGGAAVLRSSGLINVSATAHGQVNGDRVKIAGAANTGGILAVNINKEFIIRNVATNTFDVMADTPATSSVTGGGGTGTVYSKEIDDGLANENVAQGYGAGLYGAGLYGTALLSTSTRSLPRIWFDDRYANTIVMTPGNQGGVYQWFGQSTVSPALVNNAPSAVNYLFVSNNILVTLGAGGIENRIFASDQNNITQWTSSSTNQVYDDDIEGAGRLLSHCPANDLNLIFTENKVYTFRYIGLPNVWEILPLDTVYGIVAPMARVSVKGFAYWMSTENFHMYRGGKVEIIPANSQKECTALKYVFEDLNWGQKSKIFAWYNPRFDEVWFHYPSASSNDPDRVIRVSLKDNVWSIDQMNRTAAEYPSVKTRNPYLINSTLLYKHELGTDADTSPLPWRLTGPRLYNGKDNVNMNGIIPDSNQTGDITFTSTGYRYPQSASVMNSSSFIISPTTEFVQAPGGARYYQYQWEGSALGQIWEMGQWYDDVQGGSTQ